MMSVFVGETTKQIRVAPATTMRSRRYSLTARGRSSCSARRLPTGNSSFEKARGWMRVPMPAAGTTPQITEPPSIALLVPRRGAEELDELAAAVLGGVLGEGARARGGGDAASLL